nr:MAG TPA: hypothetical protein [Caudoviricetes sp.]
MATLSVRHLGKKTFQKVNPLDVLSCTYFIRFEVQKQCKQ